MVSRPSRVRPLFKHEVIIMSYSTAKWGKVKYDYESGNLTIEKLSKKYSISEPAIFKKAREDEWEKGKHKEIIQQTIAEKNIEAFAKQECGGDVVIKQIADTIKDSAEDKRILLSFIQEYNKMCGSLAPAKREVTGKDGTSLIPPGMSSQEVKEQIKELLTDDNSKAD